MFWGLKLEPGKRYTTTVGEPFHVSMAALDGTTIRSEKDVLSVILTEEKSNTSYILCNLSKALGMHAQLDLNFATGEKITFCCKGEGVIHLSGYFVPLGDEDEEDEDEEEEEDEEENELELGTRKRKAKSKLNKLMMKKRKMPTEDDSDEDVDGLEEAMAEDDSDGLEEAEDDSDGMEEAEEEEEEEEEDDSEEEVKSKKLSKVVNGTVTPGSGKKEKGGQQTVSPGSSKKEKGGQQTVTSGSSKKEKEKGGQQTQMSKQTPVVKSLEGGVSVKDIKEGTGPVAKKGKTVTVYYVGRLKANNKVFDSTTSGPGFKFRLGGGEVIKGWDVGVAGMRVGGKRLLTCPPPMAYGQKGSPPAIPPNSTLVFEVTLRAVN